MPLSRRSVLTAIPAAASLAVPATASTTAPATLALSPKARAIIAEFRDAVAREHAAIMYEMSIEASKGEPGYRRYRQAVKRSEFLTAERGRLGERIVRTPVRTLEDAVVLAVVCRDYDEQVPYGEAIGDDLPSVAVCNLIAATLMLGGLDLGKALRSGGIAA